MRKRHMLLRRQRILAPRLLRRQPLVHYIVRQHTLADALGLAEEEARTEQPVEGSAQRWWPLKTDQPPALTSAQTEEEVFASFAPSMSAQAISQSEPANPEPVQAESEQFELAQLGQAEALRRSEPIPPNWDGAGREDRHSAHGDPQGSVPVAAPLARAAAPQVNPRFLAERSDPIRLRQGEHARITELPANSEHRVPPALPLEENGQASEELPAAEEDNLLSSLPLQEEASAGEAAIDAQMPDAEEPRPAQANGELFSSRGLDRSPQAWLARLNRRAQSEMQEARKQAAPHEARKQVAPRVEQARKERREAGRAEPVAQNTRAFLKPLLGVDPASVPVYRDARAEADTASARADALSDGETIELAAEHSAQTPATLGLLAHEMTHVLRRQNPRFIPPVVRETQEATWETRDEEALALQVERQTIRMARAAQAMPFASAAPPMERGERETRDEAEPFEPARPIWGKLPAPWEPLPDWLAVWPEDTKASQSPVTRPPAVSTSPLPHASTSEGHSESESEIKRAGLERGSEEPESAEAASPPSQAEPERVPEPDLDALAQQVYTLLKRRLAVEQRREL